MVSVDRLGRSLATGASRCPQAFFRRIGLIRTKRQELHILDGCSGTLRPGRLTLLLGPPGSGKSTLLKALCGKLGNSGLEVRF